MSKKIIETKSNSGEEKEVEMFNLFKNGNKQEQEYARNFIINANQRFVVAMAKRFATNGLYRYRRI